MKEPDAPQPEAEPEETEDPGTPPTTHEELLPFRDTPPELFEDPDEDIHPPYPPVPGNEVEATVVEDEGASSTGEEIAGSAPHRRRWSGFVGGERGARDRGGHRGQGTG